MGALSLDTHESARFLSGEDFLGILAGMNAGKRETAEPNPKEDCVEQEADGSWARNAERFVRSSSEPSFQILS
jgi:hypothetical protein